MNWFWKKKQTEEQGESSSNKQLTQKEFINKFEKYVTDLMQDNEEVNFFMMIGRGTFLGKAIKADSDELEQMYAQLFSSAPEMKNIIKDIITKFENGQITLREGSTEQPNSEGIKSSIKKAQERAEKRGIPVLKPSDMKNLGNIDDVMNDVNKVKKDHNKKYNKEKLSDIDISDILKKI